jgi:hypothetical protein
MKKKKDSEVLQVRCLESLFTPGANIDPDKNGDAHFMAEVIDAASGAEGGIWISLKVELLEKYKVDDVIFIEGYFEDAGKIHFRAEKYVREYPKKIMDVLGITD